MNKTEFKTFCLDHFGMKVYTKAVYYKEMTELFKLSGATFVSWVVKDKTPAYFDATAELFIQNKTLRSEVGSITQRFLQMKKDV